MNDVYRYAVWNKVAMATPSTFYPIYFQVQLEKEVKQMWAHSVTLFSALLLLTRHHECGY